MEKILNITSNPKITLDSVASKEILKSFGRPEDNIELFIYDYHNNILDSDIFFTEYTIEDQTEENSVPSLLVDPTSILKRRGYTSGKYKLIFNLQRIKVFKTDSNPFIIKEVSSTRKELRLISPNIKNGLFSTAIKGLISEIENSSYFKDLILNFDNNINISGVNFLLNTNTPKYELLVKTLNPVPSSITTQSSCKLVESIIDPITIEIDLGNPPPTDDTVSLRGPNFNISVKEQKSIPSDYKNYDQILNYNLSSSYHNLINNLEQDEVLEIQYDYVRPVSESLEEVLRPYHFENFVHFGSAVKRLKNFKHKLKRIEDLNKKIGDIETITTPTSSAVIENKTTLNNDINKITKGFDGYERFLYYTTGSNIFTWPKQTNTIPYIPYSITSSEAQTWLGHEVDTSPLYGGQLLSASLFDRQNNHKLQNTIPFHIIENKDSQFYVDFIDMIGQHFDKIWVHIKHITKIKDTHHKRGISRNLVYHALQSLGINTFDQFENSSLTEYILGEGTGSNQYDVAHFFSSSKNPSETMVTASNEGSVPKQDITKEIWKRIYHNVPYLLKTKGTERGLRALMNCYGIPSTTLNVKEYGGPVKDKTGFKTFSYEKSGLALKGDSGTTTGFFIKTDWSASVNSTAASSSNKTVTFRIKPSRYAIPKNTPNYHLFTLSGSFNTTAVVDSEDNHLILEPYNSINTDISSSGDFSQYGRLSYYQGNTLKTSTSYFPIFNGNFWNVFINSENLNTDHTASFGAYQANSLKNVAYYTANTTTLTNPKNTWGFSSDKGAREAFFGGVPANESTHYNTVDGLQYSGSMQEIRYYFGEALSHDTLKKQALEPHMYAGNSVSSSYETLVVRLPLGSNLHENTSSFHPNIDRDYINSGSISSSLADPIWEQANETHHLLTPDTVGASMTSEKVRIDTGVIDDDILAYNTKAETSTLDRQPQDFEDLGIFLSPTSELNEDIIYTLGAFRLDDFIGSPLPSAQTSSNYSDLKELRDLYFRKIKRRYNYWDYLKAIQYIDHTLFKVIEQFVPFRANTKTGMLIEPHYLERNKFKRQLPVQTFGQTMISGSYNTFHVDLSTFTSSADKYKGSSIIDFDTAIGGGNVPTHNAFTIRPIKTDERGYRSEFGTNGTINLYDWAPIIQDGAQAPIKPFGGIEFDGANNFRHIKPKDYKKYTSNTLMGNVQKGRISTRYYRSLAIGNQNDILNNN
tara:strand:+ start:9999 stop:13610 length:3612 start_codon:yes stop_codon:yes gene_type:complete